MRRTLCALAAAAALMAGGGAALAGNSNSGSGLSPYAGQSGNDRSAGVNNGNHTQSRYNPYYRAYGRPVRGYDAAPPPRYYGYPY